LIRGAETSSKPVKEVEEEKIGMGQLAVSQKKARGSLREKYGAI